MRPDAIIKTLEDAGFEARYVGGCVRDTLLNRPIHDWDIASQALPEDVMRLFAHCVPTGIQHGTVTVLLDGVSAEVTTYRLDGAYHDGRHPDGVRFVRSLAEDLARRDFTINAMAMDEKAARSPTCLEDGRIFPAVSSAASASRKRASGRMRCGCCARTALPRSSAFAGRADAGGDPPLRAALRRSPASGCGRRRKRRFCPTGLNIFWPYAGRRTSGRLHTGGKCRFFRAFRPAKNAGGQMDSRKAALSGVRPGGVPPARKALPFD